MTKKTNSVTTDVSRIMSRIEGSGEHKRRLHATVVESIILYAATVWKTFSMGTFSTMVQSTQRRLTLKTTIAFRSMSIEAVLVVGRMMPVHLPSNERLYTFGKRDKKELVESRSSNVNNKKHEKLDYLTQALNGHGAC